MFGKILAALFFCFFVFFATAKSQTENDKNVKILFRPDVSYTEEARKNNVSGWVQVKVTFRSDGKIGEVVYFKESSEKKELTRDGLVNQAIRAAEGIKFEPATKSGQPITVKRIVQYYFSIY